MRGDLNEEKGDNTNVVNFVFSLLAIIHMDMYIPESMNNEDIFVMCEYRSIDQSSGDIRFIVENTSDSLQTLKYNYNIEVKKWYGLVGISEEQSLLAPCAVNRRLLHDKNNSVFGRYPKVIR